VRLAAVPRERHHDDIVGIDPGELFEAPFDLSTRRVGADQQLAAVAQVVGEERVQRDRVLLGVAQLLDVRGRVAVDSDEETVEPSLALLRHRPKIVPVGAVRLVSSLESQELGCLDARKPLGLRCRNQFGRGGRSSA